MHEHLIFLDSFSLPLCFHLIFFHLQSNNEIHPSAINIQIGICLLRMENSRIHGFSDKWGNKVLINGRKLKFNLQKILGLAVFFEKN